MRRSKNVACFLLLAVVLASHGAANDGPGASRVRWSKDLPSAVEKARESGRPLVIVFT